MGFALKPVDFLSKCFVFCEIPGTSKVNKVLDAHQHKDSRIIRKKWPRPFSFRLLAIFPNFSIFLSFFLSFFFSSFFFLLSSFFLPSFIFFVFSSFFLLLRSFSFLHARSACYLHIRVIFRNTPGRPDLASNIMSCLRHLKRPSSKKRALHFGRGFWP